MKPSFNSRSAKPTGPISGTTRKQLVTRFLAAAESGDRVAVNDMLGNFKGLVHSLRKLDEHSMRVDSTALHLAARNGHLGIVQDLVQANAKVDAEDFVGQTPLMEAAMYAQGDVAQFLLQKGANANHKASEGYTPLMYAARNKGMAVIETLLDHKAKINARSEAMDSALHFAIHAENCPQPVIRLLLDRGINPKLRNLEGHTAAVVARAGGLTEVAAFIETAAAHALLLKNRNDVATHKECFSKLAAPFQHGAGKPLHGPNTAHFKKKPKAGAAP